MGQDNDNAMYDYADRFINLANEIAKSDASGRVGVTIRFAAARYSAYETSIRKSNPAEDKGKELQLFAADFKNMLQFNLEDYITILSPK